MLPIALYSPAFRNNYAYGSFTSQGPVTALGSSLKNFWTADDHGTANMTDDGGGLISSWIDKVAGLALTGATTARPTYSATSFNGVAGVTGDGSANALTASAVTGLPTGINECWIYILLNQPTGATTRNVFAYGVATTVQSRTILYNSANKLQISDTTDAFASTPALIGNRLLAAHFTSAGALIEAYESGQPSTPFSVAATFNTATTRTRMWGGVAGGAANFGTATIRYILVTGALTQLQRWQIEGWACQSSGRMAPYLLRNDHPFRDRKP